MPFVRTGLGVAAVGPPKQGGPTGKRPEFEMVLALGFRV